MAKRPDPIVTMRVPPQLIRRLDAVAEARGLSRTHVILELVEQGLSHQEVAVAAFFNPVLQEAFARLVTTPGVAAQMARAMKSELSADQLTLFESTLDHASQLAKHLTAPPRGVESSSAPRPLGGVGLPSPASTGEGTVPKRTSSPRRGGDPSTVAKRRSKPSSGRPGRKG